MTDTWANDLQDAIREALGIHLAGNPHPREGEVIGANSYHYDDFGDVPLSEKRRIDWELTFTDGVWTQTRLDMSAPGFVPGRVFVP